MKKILSLVLTVTLAFSAAFSVAQKPAGGKGGMMDVSARIDKLDTEAKLKLTAPQKKKLNVSLQALQDKVMKSFTEMNKPGTKPDQGKMMAIGQKAKDEQDQIFKATLTADQFKKFKVYNDAQMAAMKAKFGKMAGKMGGKG